MEKLNWKSTNHFPIRRNLFALSLFSSFLLLKLINIPNENTKFSIKISEKNEQILPTPWSRSAIPIINECSTRFFSLKLHFFFPPRKKSLIHNFFITYLLQEKKKENAYKLLNRRFVLLFRVFFSLPACS